MSFYDERQKIVDAYRRVHESAMMNDNADNGDGDGTVVEKVENILVIGHPEQTSEYIYGFVDDSEVIPMHHTISEIGIRDCAKKARETGKTLLARDIVEFRRACIDELVKELERGGIRCIAYCGVCPCDGNRPEWSHECRCSRRQIEKWYDRMDGLDRVFRVVKLASPDIAESTMADGGGNDEKELKEELKELRDVLGLLLDALYDMGIDVDTVASTVGAKGVDMGQERLLGILQRANAALRKQPSEKV